MMLMRGDLTNRWYVVTRWKERAGKPGFYEALQKHALSEETSRALDALRGTL